MKDIESQYPYKTVKELKKEYPDCWILLLNAKYDKNYEIIGGHFVAKGKDKIKVLEKSKKITEKGLSFSHFYTGKIEIPENVILCL